MPQNKPSNKVILLIKFSSLEHSRSILRRVSLGVTDRNGLPHVTDSETAKRGNFVNVKTHSAS